MYSISQKGVHPSHFCKCSLIYLLMGQQYRAWSMKYRSMELNYSLNESL